MTKLVKVDCPDIGPATVYRTIQLLNELRLIDRINFDDGFVRYEMGTVSGCEQKTRHHHLICMKCGKVTSARDDLLEEPGRNSLQPPDFQFPRAMREIAARYAIVNHEVKLYSVCKECGGNLIEEKRE